MRRPAVFFDRDNTLIVGHDYIGDPAKVTLVPGAAPAIAKCRAMGFAVVVVSNQSGVARGMFTEADVRSVNRRLDAVLLASNGGAVIDRHEYCPFHPDAKISAYKQDSFLRKPKPGMILAAAEAMALDLAGSWVVGDAPRDITAGKAAGCRAILIVDSSLTPSPAAMETPSVDADYIVGSLVEAIEMIAEQTNKPPGPKLELPPAAPPQQPPADRDASTAASLSMGQLSIHPEPAGTPLDWTVKSALISEPESSPPVPRAAESESPRRDLSRLENVSQQILMELKKLNDHRHDDFSLTKLIAGIMQILAIATVPLAYVMYRSDLQTMQAWLLTAIFLQALTIAMLIMGRQR